MTYVSPHLPRAAPRTSRVTSAARQIEATKPVTEPVVNALRDANLIWCMVPKELSGGGLGVVDSILLN